MTVVNLVQALASSCGAQTVQSLQIKSTSQAQMQNVTALQFVQWPEARCRLVPWFAENQALLAYIVSACTCCGYRPALVH